MVMVHRAVEPIILLASPLSIDTPLESQYEKIVSSGNRPNLGGKLRKTLEKTIAFCH